jgi:hypothetical protein
MPIAFPFVGNACNLVAQSSIGLTFACELAQLLGDGRAIADPQDLSHLALLRPPCYHLHRYPQARKRAAHPLKSKIGVDPLPYRGNQLSSNGLAW